MRTPMPLSTILALTLAACGVQGDPAAVDPAEPAAWELPADRPLPPPSPAAALDLSHDLLVVGDTVQLHASGAAAGETVYFVRASGGFGAGSCPAPLGGLCLDVTGQISLLGSASADSNGDASFSLSVPASAPIGAQVHLQAAVVRGVGGVDSVKSHPVVGTLVDPLAPEACDGAVSIIGDSAYLGCRNGLSWLDAADSCDSHGGSLASITSQAEDDDLTVFAAGAGGGHWHMGYNDQANEGFFEWWDGSPTLYVDWAPGEPNNANGVEDCGELRSTTGQWNDESCTDTVQSYLCELDVTNTGASCDGEIRYHDGRPYVFCTNALDWLAADSTCSALGMRLATLDDEDENRFVGAEAAAIAAGDWWIGLNDSTVEGRYDWVDGTPTFYTNWEVNQPDNANNEDCIEIRPSSFEWNDRWCTATHGFVCEG